MTQDIIGVAPVELGGSMSVKVVSSTTTRGDDIGVFNVSDDGAVFVPVGRTVVMSDGGTFRNAVVFRVESSASRLTDENMRDAGRILDKWESSLVVRRNTE